MGFDPEPREHTGNLGVFCAFILCVILVAGLWPFRTPKNSVEWLEGANGLRFGRHGIVASAKSFRAASPSGACSLEIWLEPGRMEGSGTILTFDSSPDPKFAFALRQFGDSLAIQRASVDAQGTLIRPWLKTDRVFEKQKRVLLTIAGEQGGTAVYVNGAPAKFSSGFGLASGDLTGQLVLGNSAIRDSWSGQIIGVAVYDYFLTSPQAEAHVKRWTQGQYPVTDGERTPVALYLFNERTGNVVNERMGSGNNLVIPPRYYVLHPPFLNSPWEAYRSRWEGWMSWSYWSDVCLNVVGFIPLGFLFTAYFSLVRPIPRPRATVVVAGVALSLAIEIAQHFLPTRDSSMTDVITNTLGTIVGVVWYRPTLILRLLRSPCMAEVSLRVQNSQLP
jgi:hypothetical protein